MHTLAEGHMRPEPREGSPGPRLRQSSTGAVRVRPCCIPFLWKKAIVRRRPFRRIARPKSIVDRRFGVNGFAEPLGVPPAYGFRSTGEASAGP